MQSQEEMHHTLSHLRDAWGVDVSAAQNLSGEELWSWMRRVGSELIEREYEKAEADGKAEGQSVSKIINDPVLRNKKWWIRWPES
jgi:hypothetical protein